jgi:hypothetical protein
MDDRMTINWWLKKNVTRSSNKNSINIVECKEMTVEPKSSYWDFTEKKCYFYIQVRGHYKLSYFAV